jgi:hypothetical protein
MHWPIIIGLPIHIGSVLSIVKFAIDYRAPLAKSGTLVAPLQLATVTKKISPTAIAS